MNAKQYLSQLYRLNETINADIQESDDLRKMSTSISSPSFSGLPSGTHSTEPSFAKVIHKLIDLQEQINKEVDKYVNLKKVIKEQIDSIDDPDYRLLLQLRYLCFDTWEDIAEKMEYTYQWVFTLHKRALKYFSDKYLKN